MRNCLRSPFTNCMEGCEPHLCVPDFDGFHFGIVMVLSVGGSSGSEMVLNSSRHGEDTVTYDLLQHKATSGLEYFLCFICPSKEVISIMSKRLEGLCTRSYPGSSLNP